MIILFKLSDITLDLFPDLTKFVDNISFNKQSIIDYFIKEYAFGPFLPEVTIDDEIVSINVDTETIEKFDTDFQKAVSFAENRKFKEAKELLEDLIKKNPTISEFHRVYGQIFEVEGDIEKAKDHISEALKWNPDNKFALVMLGNIYARHYDDVETANRFYNKSLTVDPNDYIALNNIGANLAKLEKYDDAERYLDLAVKINDSYPNTHYGLGLVYEHKKEYSKSFLSAIQAMKLSLKKDKDIHNHSYGLAGNSAFEYIKADKNINNIIQQYKEEIEKEGNVKIKIESSKEIATPAKTEYAENYNRDYHLVRYNSELPGVHHLIMHELTHINFSNKAKKVGKNINFATGNTHRELFIRNSEKQISLMSKNGIPEQGITQFINSLFDGLMNQMFNAPIDLFIEDYLYNKYPENRPYQFFALQSFQKTYVEGSKNKDIKKFTPKFVLEANNILNITHALQIAELFGYDFTPQFDDLILYKAFGNKLYNQFLDIKKNYSPGEEYTLLKKWSKELKLNQYHKLIEQKDTDNNKRIDDLLDEIKKDPLNFNGNERKDAIKRVSYKDNPAGSMAVTMYCLDALKTFEGKEKNFVQEVTLEIALLGTFGLYPGDTEKKYSLKSIPDKQFTALHLLSFEYVGFQMTEPSLDTQLDFKNEYENAKKLFIK